MKKNKIILAIIMAGVLFMIKSHTALAAGGPFTCSPNFYHVISGQLKILNPTDGTYSNVGSPAGFNYNAIGYNTLDNYIYGIVTSGTTPAVGDLIKVASDGAVTDLGLPSGLPAVGYVNGSFDSSGNLYIHSHSTVNDLYKVNIASLTVTHLTLTGTPESTDDSVIINNKMYEARDQNLDIIDLNTLVASSVNVPSLPSGGDYGAAWTDSANELFFSDNNTGSIYQITGYDTLSPTAVFKVAGTVTNNNDGASCALSSQNPFESPTANNDSYTTAYNTTLNKPSGSLLVNDVGSSLTITSNTNPTHGSVTVNSDGSFTYIPTHGFVGVDSFTYTVTDSFGRTATATVSITVNIQAPNTGFAMIRSNPLITLLVTLIATGTIAALAYRYKIINS